MTLHNKFSLFLTEKDGMKILMEKLENWTFHSLLQPHTHVHLICLIFTFLSAPLHIRLLYILAVQCSLSPFRSFTTNGSNAESHYGINERNKTQLQ